MSNPTRTEILNLCVKLAQEALEAGDAPFGSVLVSGDGKILRQDRNRDISGENGDGIADSTMHPEYTLARWAMRNMSPEERAKATVYTSGEHCAMCSAAHAWCGLGPIVYVSSTKQYGEWMKEAGITSGPVSPLSIQQVAPGIKVEGPIEGLDQEVKKLHVQRWAARK